MKKWLSLIMALAMLVCMTACDAKPDDNENGTTTTTSNQVVQQDTIQTFLNDPANNGFVGQYYDAPENIKLSAALYDGAGIGVFGTTNWTEQEKQDVLAAAGWDAFHNPPLKLIRSDVENLVKDKLGLSLSEIKTKLEDSWCYIEKYDAYYVMHGDSNSVAISVVETQYDNNGVYTVKYTAPDAVTPTTGIVKLLKTDNGFQFLSNQKVTSVSIQPHLETTPSSSPSDYLTAVLEDEQTFVYNGEEMTLSHVLSNYEDAIGRYALVDMDADKQPEIAVEFDSQNFILVLHKDSDAYYGYLFTFRSMYQLNSDGSFYWNSGAGNHGCSRLVFKGNEYEKVELWRAERSEDGSEAYYVEGNKVSEEDFDSVVAEKKEPVEWVAWADTPTDDTTTATPTTTTCFTTATSTAPTNKTTETTVPKITAITNAYTAADLFFPIHNAALKAPETATMQEVSIAFDAARKRGG